MRNFPGVQFAASRTVLQRHRQEVSIPTGHRADPVGEWRKQCAFFPAPQPLVVAMEQVAESSVPEPYKTLLLHNNLMTATMERFHGAPVGVRVLERRIDGTAYRREILLFRQDTGTAVQFAFAEIDLDAVSEVVQQEILSEQVPLGRVLVSHGMNCQIEVKAILKITLGTGLAELLHSPVDVVTYGRVARTLCNGKPTFNVIEVLAPIHP
jgi:hypothetical protein